MRLAIRHIGRRGDAHGLECPPAGGPRRRPRPPAAWLANHLALLGAAMADGLCQGETSRSRSPRPGSARQIAETLGGTMAVPVGLVIRKGFPARPTSYWLPRLAGWLALSPRLRGH